MPLSRQTIDETHPGTSLRARTRGAVREGAEEHLVQLVPPLPHASQDVCRGRQRGGLGHLRAQPKGGWMPAFGLVVNDRGEILLIQRGYGGEKGKWSLPGGQRDKGESLRETARRETYEETGIRMAIDSLYAKGNRAHWEVWRGRHIGGHLRVQKRECLDAKWFKRDMLPHDENLAFGPDKTVIRKWASETPGSRRVHYPSPGCPIGFALVCQRPERVLLVQRRGGTRR